MDAAKSAIEALVNPLPISPHQAVLLKGEILAMVEQGYVNGQHAMLRMALERKPREAASDDTLVPYYLVDKQWADTLLASMAK